ncbi:hypothetical protein CPJCM30710_16840 [Clostridium polyendosporum]|uniref:ABC-2 type transport system permease protein n=1 Tax=Clostridium polyendosporum TaxID=69208 RepID=A0A919S1S2_9CLOT|nr:hypothetical protein [Clostridium polyendosporum]GIM29018.1 hypothetical protein CPJCM30710_16840 [Clostridium polyendosporum]
MNKVWILTKVFLKTGFGEGTRIKKQNNSKIFNIVLLLVTMPMILFSIGITVFGVFEGLKMINQEDLLIGLAYNISSVITFVFGIMSVMSIFYFSKDINFVLPLPFRPREITLAKFITVVIYQYVVTAFILIPTIFIYGVRTGAEIGFYLTSLICFILLPILPTVYCSLISMILMNFTNLSKHKDAFKIFTGFLAIAIAIIVNFFSTKMGANATNGPGGIADVANLGKNVLIDKLSNFFITAKVGAYATVGDTPSKILINITLFILINVLAVIIFSLVTDKFYFKGAVGASESYGSRKKLKEEVFQKSLIEKSPLKTWLVKELTILVRTPAYLLNCVSTIVIIPIILVMPILAEENFETAVSSARRFLSNSSNFTIIIAATFGIVLFISSTNPTASTSISREGDNLYISKFLPVDYLTQLTAKILSAIIINGALILIAVVVMILLGGSVTVILLILILAILELYFMAVVGVLIDLSSPKLVWDDEQKAVKQNLNPLKCTLIGLILGGASTGVTVASWVFIKGSFIIYFGILAVIIITLDVVMYNLLRTKGVKMFKSLSD